ncbi:uncharacterized protein BX663DRAFT_542019 [Cokeromyces recurvatus]|uniref:uncharacterized protein n=1 Tax=Cokeromyces recurvatus TaxID=90255 RepID=UPI00221F3ECC|nr:uncharacterized protein BX663DRAFT_542019 [Cokeromyces recurvatus]KAI7904350.1 hypothetical protein BX663DRAFT_542019 [Cokeromyces recurvatus]
MILTRQPRLIWIFLLFFNLLFNFTFAKKNNNHQEEENTNISIDTPEFTTPKNQAWLEGLDLSLIKGSVRPIGSGICKNAKCDGNDNEDCFESCGNMASPDDIYGCLMDKTWALTFDDGPSNFTTDLLDALDKTNVKVTFCVMGAHAKMYPDIIRRAYQSGHQIASHTYSHPHLMSLTNEEIVYELRATEEAIQAAIGIKPLYIRPPYGEADSRVKAIFKQMGYKTLMWNVDPTDYDVHELKDGPQRIQRVFDSLSNGSYNSLNANNDLGFISLQHDLYKTSIDQVPKIIKSLQNKGYQFMTAAECIGDKNPHSALVTNPSNTDSDIHHQLEEKQQASNDNRVKQAAVEPFSSESKKSSNEANNPQQHDAQVSSSSSSLNGAFLAMAFGLFGIFI